ncbi:MAG: tyrosine-type recombinase/integrase, partial [Planctomycetota bacterium]|nr:tyrosine-type recombinase/integrase [Planctomycetota bacterium]
MTLRFSRLDRKAIRSLKSGEKITEHGITAERLRDGDIRYSVNVMVDGQRIHRVIGRESDDTTRTQAEEFISKVRADAKGQRLNLPKGRKVALTFKTASELYLSRLEESEGKNLEEKRRHFKLYLVPSFGKMPLDKISTFTLEKYRKACKAQGLKSGTINRHLATYRHMANKLLEWDKVASPMAMVKLERESGRREHVLSTEEKESLLVATLNDSNTRIWLFIMVGLNTSLRHREILSSRFENFDASRRRLRVKVKGGEWREQPLTRTITKILQHEREMADDPDGWIFPNSASRSGHVESMKAPFRRVVISSGQDPKKVTPHTMR